MMLITFAIASVAGITLLVKDLVILAPQRVGVRK